MSWTRLAFVILTRSSGCARLLFGGRFQGLPPGDRYFDATTWALKCVLAEQLQEGARVLEIGTGPHATLARWLSAERGCEVVTTEVEQESALRARERLERAGLPVEVRTGAHFADVPEPLDVVVFNPPYVPSAVGEARGLSERFRAQWDGGPEGTTVIAEFLDELGARSTGARVFLGVNGRHVSRERMAGLLAERPSLVLLAVARPRFLGVDVYQLRRAD